METLDQAREYLKKSRKRERQCARTIKGKALLVIDHLLSLDESEDRRLCQIYRIAHSATGVCLNPHKEWKKDIDDLYDKLKG